jgi:hypothetical protein
MPEDPFCVFAVTADQHGDCVEDSWTGLLVVPGHPGAPGGQRLVSDSQKVERAVERGEAQCVVALLDGLPRTPDEAEFVEAARAANTLRWYRSCWRVQLCRAGGARS